jgi:hypothetical protein
MTTEELVLKVGGDSQGAKTAVKTLADTVVSSFATAAEGTARWLGPISDLSDHLAAVAARASTFSGDKIIQEAHQIAAAVTEIGGADRLTAAEQKEVNRTLGEAIAKYQALGETAPAPLRALHEQTAGLSQPTSLLSKVYGDLGDQVKATMLGFLSGQAILSAVRGTWSALSGFVSDSITSYANAEAAAKKMTVALQAQGTATPATIAQFNALATQFQQTTVYSDDLINEMEALLTQVGNVAPSQMNRALRASSDLASGLGIDLQAATMLVAKAFAGGGDELGRLKAILGEAYRPGMDMAGVLGAIEEKFGGQAQAEIETYAGRVKQLANEWDNFKEAVGEAIVTDPRLVALLDEIQGKVTGIGQNADGYRPTITDWWARLAGGPFAELTIGYLNSTDKLIQDIGRDTSKLPAPPKQFADFGSDMAAHLAALKRESDDVVRTTVEGWQKQAEAAKKYADAVQGILDKALLRDVTRESQEWNEALTRLGGSSALSAQAFRLFAEEAVKLREEGVALSPQLQELAHLHDLLAIASAHTKADADADAAAWKAQGDAVAWFLSNLHMAVLQKDSFKGVTTLIDVQAVQASLTAVKEAHAATFNDIEGRMRASGVFTKAELVKQAAVAKEQYDSMLASGKYTTAELEAAWKQMTNANDAATDGMAASIHRTLSSIPQQIIAAMTGGGGISGAFKSIGSSFGVELGTKAFGPTGILKGIGDMIPGIGPAIGSLLGPVVGWISNLFSHAGRDAVKDFAASFGGFDDLHVKLDALGDAGEQLWVKLTQGVGRNNPEQAKQVIGEIQAALEKIPPSMTDVATQAGYQTTAQLQQAAADAMKLWTFMRDSGQYTADAVQQAWERAQTALKNSGDQQVNDLQRAFDAAKSQLGALDSEIASLQASIANEAPEEVMGVVEAQARARLEALQRERDAAAAHVEDLQNQLTDAMNRVADALEHLPKDLEFNIHTNFPGGSGSDGQQPPGASTGGVVTDGGITPFRFALGGMVPRVADFLSTRGPGIDSVPAYLYPGEIVINAMQQGRLASALLAGAGNQAPSIVFEEGAIDASHSMFTDDRAIRKLADRVGDEVARRYKQAYRVTTR